MNNAEKFTTNDTVADGTGTHTTMGVTTVTDNTHLLDVCMSIRAHSRVFQSLGRDKQANVYRWLQTAIRDARDRGAPWSLVAHSAQMSPATVKRIYSEVGA